MEKQLRIIQAEQSKEKFAGKVSAASDELQYLMKFNKSISQTMAKTRNESLVFVSMANHNLVRWDSYLTRLRSGNKSDTLAALRTAPLHIATLFLDNVLKKVEERHN